MHAVSTAFLGCVARGICGLHDGGRGFPTGMHRHQADAGADAHAMFLVHEAKLLHPVAQGLPDLVCPVRCAMFQQDRELVATQARHHIAAAHRVAQHGGHLLQQPVAGGVPAGVVDQLEAIEVDVHQRMLGAFFACRAPHASQPRIELCPVDQPGQRIVRGTEADLPRQAALLGDVPKNNHHAQRGTAFLKDRRHRAFDTELLAVPRNQDALGSFVAGLGAVACLGA